MVFEEFKDECLTALGGNLVDVELEDRDYQYAFKQAKKTFQQKGHNSYRRSFVAIEVEKGKSTYDLPDKSLGEIDTIVKIIRPNGAGGAVGNPFQQLSYNDMMQGIGTSSHGCGGCGANFLQYELTLQRIEMMQRYAINDVQFVHDKFKNTIKLLKLPERDMTIVIECYTNLSDEEYMEVLWVQKWTIAELKQILGTAYRKFNSLAAPTGETSLNGSEYIQESKEEKRELLEDIENFTDGDIDFMEIRFG